MAALTVGTRVRCSNCGAEAIITNPGDQSCKLECCGVVEVAGGPGTR